MRVPCVLVSLCVLLGAFAARAEEPSAPLARSGRFRPRLSLVDVPFNVRHGAPSMRQAADMQELVMGGGSWAIDLLGERIGQNSRSWVRPVVEVPLLLTWALLGATVLPGGDAWFHEEWHRAVLSRHGVSSFNGVYELRLFSEFIYVKHVSDEGLTFIKEQHPQDFVRLSAAGMEAQVASNVRLQRDIFYDRRSPARDVPRLWLNAVSVFQYLRLCVGTRSEDALGDDVREVDIAERDFTGLDCSGWIYDLENDRQPYAERGVHPSGIGVDRYRYADQLSPEGRSYLKRASWLSLLNFASPQLFGVGHLPVPGRPEDRWSFALSHQLTSFGQVVDGHLLASLAGWNVGATYHHYLNGTRAFPGLELRLVRWPVPTQAVSAHLSAEGWLWLQPSDGRFMDTRARLGGGGSLALAVDVLPRLAVYAELDAKSAGWVTGNVYLGSAVQGRLGLEAAL
ncbi:hypothetical protein [Hyalangium rubrum]|uniref:Uncharacterized protein n=1 Tax=Hyalangium rubrum TaxID=3103134 RepID=A0ABU5HBT3_9BACT|nr:hypothetical protein [Hyalangium sp. s54d21]MDY7230277.1 hypothetical protein [Hyalangium sp. s54d21]